jgi:hypothetical protein
VDIFSRSDFAAKVRSIQMEPSLNNRTEAARFFTEEAQLWGREAKIPMQ